MATIQSYLPIDRRFALASGVPLVDRNRGAALFADISGFTPLTVALVRELGSRRGAEALVTQLNRVYTALVGEVHAFGGAAINFSGDSITCWFDATGPTGQPATDDLPGAAARALACGLELQRIMSSFQAIVTPDGTIIPLALKVALAAGAARRFLVGDPSSYVLEVLAGTTLDRMAAAEELTGRGEIVVSAELLNFLPSPPIVREWRRDAGGAYGVIDRYTGPVARMPWPSGSALAEDVARRWLLPPVYAHLQTASEAFLAELRNSVTLFVRFSGIDYDHDDEAGDKLNTFVCQVQDVLNRYEGYLLQITMGDKGGYLHASFGAPVAHEDDAERAAMAALEIAGLTEATGYFQPPQIGISSGLVYSGAYGSPDRSTYGVIGQDVNLSARLMTAATAGQVLVSGHLAETIEQSFELAALPPLTLKGLSGPVESWELRGRRLSANVAQRLEPDGSMVGRALEQAILDDLLGHLLAGQSSLLIIEGEAGIGKSLLTENMARRVRTLAQQEGNAPRPVLLAGYGDAIEQTTPYFAWRSIFEQLFGISDREHNGLTSSAIRDRIVDMLAPDLRYLAPLLNVVLPLELPETPLTEQITGEARQDNIHLLLVSVLMATAAVNPLVLILDDAHWLDSVSWTLARRVRRDVEPLLMVLVTRPMGDDRPAAFVELSQSPESRLLTLDTLPPDAIDELVCRRLGVRSLPSQVARLIHEKAEGHPFFSEELAYALRDGGLIETVDGECRLIASVEELMALDFPNSIEGVITSRIDSLPPGEQLTVKVASVIGRIFAYRLLREIYPVARDVGGLRHNLDHLEQLDITSIEMPEPELTYFFKHILTQEVVYDLMTSDQTRRLHHETAVWYERSGESDPSRLYPLVAYHYRMAEDRVEASSYYGKAGANAFRDFANREAIHFLTLALELCGDETPLLQRAHWHTLIGEASYRLTLMEQSEAHYLQALTLLDQPVPSSTADRGMGLAGELLRQVAHRLAPNHYVGRATPEQRATLLEAARASEGIAEVYYNAGDQLVSFYSVMSTLNLSEEAGPSPELIRSYANMAATFAIVSLTPLAESYRARALAMAAENDDLAARAAIQIPFSVYSVWIGAWDRAEEETAVALDIYSRLGEWRRWGVAAWILPQVAQSKGQLVRGCDLWWQLYGVALRSEDTRHQVRSRGGQFFNFLALGQPEDALTCATQVDELLDASPEMVPVEERLWFGLRARRAMLRANQAEARTMAREQMAAIKRAQLKFDLLDVFAGPAVVLLALWEQGVATEDEAKQGCKIISSYARSYPFARACAHRLNGRFAWLSGKEGQAEKLWQKSLAQADKLVMPYERALTLAVMGEALDRADYAVEAATILAQCRSESAP